MNELSNLISWKNRKLNYPIFNITPAKNCESKKLGLCKVCSKCYANKAEYLYPQVLPYRLKQENYWNKTDANKFVLDFLELLKHKINKPKYFRFDESGDFKNQEDVNKLVEIANQLKKHNIQVYTYTARTDLNFSNIGNLVINGSGFLLSNNFQAIKTIPAELKPNEKICAGNCRLCKLCTKKHEYTIYCKIH